MNLLCGSAASGAFELYGPSWDSVLPGSAALALVLASVVLTLFLDYAVVLVLSSRHGAKAGR